MVAYNLIQNWDGGSNPTPSLSLKEMRVFPTQIERVAAFIEKWHYSHSVNGIKSRYCFKLMCGNGLIGAAVFGGLGMANNWKKYSDSEDKLIELRRLCCIDEAPKNTESFFIGACIRWLKKNTTIEKIVSFADPTFGHVGIIYRATGFKYLGQTSPSRVIVWNGRRYHDKAIRTKYGAMLKPFAVRLKEALDSGGAQYEHIEGKHTYLMDLVRRGEPTRQMVFAETTN